MVFEMPDARSAGDCATEHPGHGIVSNCQFLDLILLGDLVIRAPKDLLKKCPFFENMFNSKPDQRSFQTEDCGVAVNAFLGFLRGEVPYPDNAFAFIKFGVKIRFTPFIEACVLNAQFFSIPPGFSSRNAIPISKALIACLPSRRIEEYDCILRGVETECRCEQKEYFEDILEEVRRKCSQPCQLPLVSLFEKKLTLAIMTLIPGGTLGIAALIKGEWKPMPIIGCPELQGITNFHLVFGKHFIYSMEPDNKVFVKDLTTEEPAAMFCEASKIFRSHFGNLVVVTTENNVDSLYIWSTSSNRFEKIFANSEVTIRNVSWPRDSKNLQQALRILTEERQSITLDKSGRYLTFSDTAEDIKDWVRDLCLVEDGYAYRSTNDAMDVLFIDDVTHVGFSKIAVRALNREIGVYQTSADGFYSGSIHGRVDAISDVYLGVDHTDPHLPCTRNS